MVRWPSLTESQVGSQCNTFMTVLRGNSRWRLHPAVSLSHALNMHPYATRPQDGGGVATCGAFNPTGASAYDFGGGGGGGNGSGPSAGLDASGLQALDRRLADEAHGFMISRMRNASTGLFYTAVSQDGTTGSCTSCGGVERASTCWGMCWLLLGTYVGRARRDVPVFGLWGPS